MSYEIVLDNEWATVRYHTQDKYIHHTFHKPISGKPIYEVLNAGLDSLKKQKATKWLSDDRNNAELPPEDGIFAATDWGPRAAKAGWKYWALVVPESIAARASMRNIVEIFHNLGVRVAIFTKLEEAKTWLANC